MRTLAATLGASVLLFFSVGCENVPTFDVNGPTTIGSGRFITVTRPVQGFSGISVSSAARAIVTQGAVESLEITAEDNIVPFIESTVVNGELVLGLRANAGSLTTGAIVFRVGLRELRVVRGSAAAQIEIDGLDTPHLVLDLSSAAGFSASGFVDRFEFDLSSASRLQGARLASRVATGRLSSASNGLLRVRDSLTAAASSAAVLDYFGDPLAFVQASSGGVVRRVGP
jgi:hypothetical protein